MAIPPSLRRSSSESFVFSPFLWIYRWNWQESWTLRLEKKFRKDVLQLFGSSVHHVEATPSGSFFLLATFRHFTFRLSEESVAFALSSCLGGAPASFHVQFQSEGHFRFSVANKAVGFHVYSLRRFTGDHFDVYFHLWRNGTANWEREKRLWDLEQAKQWQEVIYRSTKRKAKPSKRVSFASSPVCIPSPATRNDQAPTSIAFGKFFCQIAPNNDQFRSTFGSNSRSVDATDACSSENSTCRSADKNSKDNESHGSGFKNSTSKNIVCWNCLLIGHVARYCSRTPRCKYCYNYGHRAQQCLTRNLPRAAWRPKQKSLTEDNNRHHEDGADSPAPSSATPSADPTVGQTSSPPPLPSTIASPVPVDVDNVGMANFDVDLSPYIPEGFDLEQWARPARGRMVIFGNPPRRHEMFAIATMTPAPQNLHSLHQAMDDVRDYFQQVRLVYVESICPSPLGLCLIRFRSAIRRQSMINLSPHLLPGVEKFV